jgi:hypothetical protein
LVVVSMQDFLRDWRRWTIQERVAAIMIALGLIGLPLSLAI